MHANCLLLLLLIPSATPILSEMPSASTTNDKCPLFYSQGSNMEKTIIRLLENHTTNIKNEPIIDNRWTYEWEVHAREILDTSNDLVADRLAHAPRSLLVWKASLLSNRLKHTENVIQYDEYGRALVINNGWIKSGTIYTIYLQIIQYEKTIATTCLELIKTSSASNGNDFDLILIGPNRIFCNNLLIMNAFVVGNYVNATFKFQWSLKESPGAIPQRLEYGGSRLELTPNTLNNDRTYEVICELIDDNEEIVAMESHQVTIRKPQYTIRLENRNQTVGVNQPIKIIAFVDIPKQFNPLILWTCITNTKPCGEVSNMTTLYLIEGFPQLGLYEFVLTVTEKDFNEKLTVFVEVINSTHSIEFDEIPVWVAPAKGVDIPAKMLNIRTGCALIWISIHNVTTNATDVEYKAVEIAKTNYYKSQLVFVNGDVFLKELAPFSDEPGNQKITLKIVSELLDIEEDAKYLLRLSTSCGSLNVIYADVEFATNAPPLITEFRVSPLKGEALSTTFVFETTPGTDKSWDMPLTYSFGWSTSNHEITYFSKIQDFPMTESILPFIKKTNGTLRAIVRVCDNKDSCTTIQGPKIKVMLLEGITKEKHSIFIDNIRTDLAINDFEKFAIDFLMIYETYNNFQNEFLLDDFQMAMNSLLNKKIQHLLDKSDKYLISDFILSLESIKFIFKPSDGVLRNLQKLCAKLLNVQLAAQIVTDKEEGVIEKHNSKDLNSPTIQDIRSYLKSTEFIITTSTDRDLIEKEKQNFIMSMDKYLSSVCLTLYRDPERKNVKFKFQTAYIVLEKFSNSYFRNFKYIPNPTNEWNTNIKILLNQSWYIDIKDKPLCIAKAILRNYLNHKGLLYYAKLFSNVSSITLTDQTNTITKTTRTPNLFICSVYSEDTWHQCRKDPVSSSNLVCICKKLGFIRITDIQNEEDKVQGHENNKAEARGFKEIDNAESQPRKEARNQNNVTIISVETSNEVEKNERNKDSHNFANENRNIDDQALETENNLEPNGKGTSDVNHLNSGSKNSELTTPSVETHDVGNASTENPILTRPTNNINYNSERSNPTISTLHRTDSYKTSNSLETESNAEKTSKNEPNSRDMNTSSSYDVANNSTSTTNISTVGNSGNEDDVENSTTNPKEITNEVNAITFSENMIQTTETRENCNKNNEYVTASSQFNTAFSSNIGSATPVQFTKDGATSKSIESASKSTLDAEANKITTSTDDASNANNLQITSNPQSTTLAPPRPTSEIRMAGISSGSSSMPLGDRMSYGVIALSTFGMCALVVYGLILKRVRKVHVEQDPQTEFPMYANIYKKENMHGDF